MITKIDVLVYCTYNGLGFMPFFKIKCPLNQKVYEFVFNKNQWINFNEIGLSGSQIIGIIPNDVWAINYEVTKYIKRRLCNYDIALNNIKSPPEKLRVLQNKIEAYKRGVRNRKYFLDNWMLTVKNVKKSLIKASIINIMVILWQLFIIFYISYALIISPFTALIALIFFLIQSYCLFSKNRTCYHYFALLYYLRFGKSHARFKKIT